MSDIPQPKQLTQPQPIKWNNKEIKDLTDDELKVAGKSLSDMHEFRESKKLDPRWEKRFENRPMPEPNPLFVKLKATIEAEINNRSKPKV